MKIPFKTSKVEGDESVMVLKDIKASEIRFNIKTREIFIITEKILPPAKPKKKGSKRCDKKRN